MELIAGQRIVSSMKESLATIKKLSQLDKQGYLTPEAQKEIKDTENNYQDISKQIEALNKLKESFKQQEGLIKTDHNFKTLTSTQIDEFFIKLFNKAGGEPAIKLFLYPD